MNCTSKSTQPEIVTEALLITTKERVFAEAENAKLLLALRDESGLLYSYAVKQARYQLQIVDYTGRSTKVIPVSELMPFYELNEFLRNFKHAEGK